MNTATQQFPANPALDFAQSVLDETNGALELIEILHDIAEGNDEDATTNDRIAATKVLLDRGLGKCPKQTPVLSLVEGPNPNPAPETEDNDVEPAPYSIRGAIRESPSAATHNTPESPRLVTQIDDTLNQSLGPAPSAHTPTLQPVAAGFKPARPTDAPQTPYPFDPYSIHFTIQQHIFAITNNGQTLQDTLLEIARANDDPRTTPYHRRRAATLLIDRVLGTDPNALHSGVCPDCRQRWTTHPDSPAHPGTSSVVGEVKDLPSEEKRWASIEAKLNRMEEEGIITPDPNPLPIDVSRYRMPKDFDSTPFEKEEAAAFWAEIALRVERQKKWPEIEERRRKKLEQIYPSHSDDLDDPPDT